MLSLYSYPGSSQGRPGALTRGEARTERASTRAAGTARTAKGGNGLGRPAGAGERAQGMAWGEATLTRGVNRRTTRQGGGMASRGGAGGRTPPGGLHGKVNDEISARTGRGRRGEAGAARNRRETHRRRGILR